MSTEFERDLLLREAAKIVDALAQTFAPLCEVVLHDLTRPDHAIVKIENNLSGRTVGGPATELGLARIADPGYPDVIANYANSFADGRPVKSTSIGLRDSSGNFVAAICLNMDVSYLRSVTAYLTELTQVQPAEGAMPESLVPGAERPGVEAKILAFAASRNKDPRSLTSDEKREIVRRLADDGDLERRGAAEQVAGLIGGSRSSVYYYLNGTGRKAAR